MIFEEWSSFGNIKDFMSHPLVFTKLGLLAKLGSQDNVWQREVEV